MKQTAVEWLSEQLQSTVFYTDEAKENIINQAKEMEKQQIIYFTDDYVDNCVIPNENMAIPTKMDVPSYFKEKFSQQEQ